MVASTGSTEREGWSSRSAFILAAIGAAVGLGNVWRFPTLAGENGGGAFVLFYVGCVFLLGLPLVLAEIFIGRTGQDDAVGSIRKVAQRSGASGSWSGFGVIGVLAAFLILSFYSVVAGWVLYYVGVMGGDFLGAVFSGEPFRGALAGESREMIQGRMGNLFADPMLLLTMHLVFMGATLFIVARGIGSGIEAAATILMPMFFVLLVGITVYGAFVGEMGGAIAFLFTPDFGKLTPQAMNEALGQALFSLSLGVAGLITYGSYIKGPAPLGPTAVTIAIADTSVALIAGLMIFPIVLAVGLDPAAGPTLVFQTLPFAFQTMPGGALIGLLFFILILVAAITSSISLLEVPVAWGIGEMGWSRRTSSLVFGGGAFVIGVACLLGYNVWSDVRPLGFWPLFADTDILDTVDGFTGKVMLPLVAFFTAVFVGWKADRRLVEEMTGLSGFWLSVWRALIAWLCPLAVGVILVTGLFPQVLGS
ncbi:Na+ symporter, NSS family [Erythrobacter litoralis]|jgi:NSS family neurotransmitter:Na+ symporter|uniref:Transporter n=1 Tax=Erythrobacter litoralis TaxID=39960 RepID=A0A074MUX4_9SPHN|nr:sodium-dependent transporter [Erythrobacter litoralis]AOL23690.1 Na+ symporter, NSS family [Erythrobacter litoralis]KEO98826.1 transporter [Erythrobacter litoralis]MEE4339214.1 sodium-dependent transporter [Erythrobacter sp.]